MKKMYPIINLFSPLKRATIPFTFVLLAFTSYSTLGQINLQWANTFGGTAQDVAQATATDASGNLYVSGHFSDTIDLDPSASIAELGGNMAPNLFLAKYNSSGAYQWSVNLDATTMPIFVEDIAADASGNVYITGHFGNTVDFDPGTGTASLTATGTFDIFLAKYNSNGGYEWAINMGGPAVDFGRAVAVDASGNVIIGGYYMISADFDPGTGTTTLTSRNGSPDGYLAKYTSSGSLLWAKSLGSGTSQDEVFSVQTDNSGNVYAVGNYGGKADFGATDSITSNGALDAFIVKYNSSGTYQWSKSFGGPALDKPTDLVVAPWGDAYVTGYFNASIDFDTLSINGNGGKDLFVAGFKANGEYNWINTAANNSADDEGIAIALDNTTLYTTGTFQDTINFGDSAFVALNRIATGSSDIFVSATDTAGKYVWARSFGGTAANVATDISAAGGTLSLVGHFLSSTVLEPQGTQTYTSDGMDDFFIAQYQLSCYTPSFYTIVDTICKGGIYFLGNQQINAAGEYYEVVSTGAPACDSIVKLTLAIDVIDTSVTKSGFTLTAASGLSYQWINCDSSMAIAGETNQSFTATYNGNFAVVVSNTYCSDTSSCFELKPIGLSENAMHRLKVYPNPSNGNFTVELTQPEKLSILDINGRIVFEASLFYGKNTLDLTHLPKGVYLLKSAVTNQHSRLIIK